MKTDKVEGRHKTPALMTDHGECPKGSQHGAEMETRESPGSILDLVVGEGWPEMAMVEDEEGKETWG